jgi:hypothetical protein
MVDGRVGERLAVLVDPRIQALEMTSPACAV